MSEKQFEQSRVRRSFDRAADTYSKAAVLQHEISERLLEALDVVRLDARQVLDAGCGTGEAFSKLQQRFNKAQVVAMDLSENMLSHVRSRGGLFKRPDCVCAELESLPFADASFDLVFSSLAIQWCNSHADVFSEVHRILRPGGLFVFTSFGPDTLKELRKAWAEIDEDAHVNQFIDMHDLGDELLRCSFAEPVMHAENLVVQYQQLRHLLQDLRDIGANVTEHGHRTGLMTPALVQRLEQNYEQFRDDDVLPASYEVLYGHAWKAERTAPPVPGCSCPGCRGSWPRPSGPGRGAPFPAPRRRRSSNRWRRFCRHRRWAGI